MDIISEKQTTTDARQDALARALKENLEIKDRKLRTKTYHQCFLHSGAVDWVRKHENVDEATAVATLNDLRVAEYIQHVVDPHKSFKVGQTKKLYFCFLDDERSHVRQQKQKAASNNEFLKLMNPQMFQDVLQQTDEFRALQIKMHRMESTLSQMNDTERCTTTRLEIIHQATISLIQTMVTAAFLLMLVLAYIVCVIVPSLHQNNRNVVVATFFFGALSIGAFVLQGMNLFSVWLQLDGCVVNATEGKDAVEDYEVDAMTVSSVSTIESASATRNTRLVTKQRRQSSLFLKESRSRRSSFIQNRTAATVEQRKASDLPPISQWSHRPVLLCVNTPACKTLHVPDYSTGACPIGKPFSFSSSLFEGKCLVRIKDIPNSDAPQDDEAYFAGRRRLFQTIVQGRFKQPLPVDQVLTGHEFVQPFKNLPHPWILKAATNIIGKLAPGAEIRVLGNQPTMLASLAATSQVVRGDEPGNEPNLAATTEVIQEDCSLFGGKFRTGKVSASGRKLHLANPKRAAKYTFDTETVYTFDFYQSLLNVKTYSLELGVANIGMARVLNGQPIQCLCKTTNGRYLWSFQIWHESLLPPGDSVEGDGKKKQ